jgi:glycosyltransferase involved in cell wall biosynthesis
MRIGLDITPVIYEHTGVGVYTRELVFHLLKHFPKDNFILFASTLRGQKKLWEYLRTLAIYSNFTIKIYPFPPLITETLWNRLHRFSVEKLVGQVDVFHAWDWQQPPAKRAKIVTTIHDLTTLKFPRYQHPQTVTVHRRRLHWVTQETTAIIADSQATKRDIIDFLNVPPDKVHVVYLAAGAQFSPPTKEETTRIRQKYHLPDKFILTASVTDHRKNAEAAIKASSLPVFSLTGSIPLQDLPALYAAAAVFVFPSLYEGFGLPVLEAMAVGTPVVTSDRGSLKEVAGTAAILVDPESTDSITQGINQALATRDKLIAAGLDQAKRFSWDKTAQQTMEVYKLCL